MGYDKKIRYLDYLENGMRVRGGGFLKTELSDDYFKLGLTVKGVRGAKELAPDVILCGKGREEILGKILLEDGQGELRHECQASSGIGGTGISCTELTGVRISLGEGREIACQWGELIGGTERNREERIQEERNREGKIREEKHQEEKIREEKHREETIREENPQEEKAREIKTAETVKERVSAEITAEGKKSVQEKRQEIKLWEVKRPKARPVQPQRDIISQSREQRSENIGHHSADAKKQSKDSGRQPEIVTLLENKWLQLCAIYPHIKPFQDQREYLSIGPEDFVLLSSASYKAAGNSFMLHGYYNYQHLILAREERRGEILYYVGVPGNYYDREKQVAVMFGFESFECAQEPVQSADFGYYMMRVEL